MRVQDDPSRATLHVQAIFLHFRRYASVRTQTYQQGAHVRYATGISIIGTYPKVMCLRRQQFESHIESGLFNSASLIQINTDQFGNYLIQQFESHIESGDSEGVAWKAVGERAIESFE